MGRAIAFAFAIAISRRAKLHRYSSSASSGLYGYPVLKSATGFQTFAQEAIERYVLSLTSPCMAFHSSSLPFTDTKLEIETPFLSPLHGEKEKVLRFVV
jgi:hypothetical protein